MAVLLTVMRQWTLVMQFGLEKFAKLSTVTSHQAIHEESFTRDLVTAAKSSILKDTSVISVHVSEGN